MGLIKRIQECCLRGSRIGILRSGILNPGHPLHHRGYSIRFRTRAVIFDMGGVILPSPHPITKEYETERNIPLGTIAKTIETNGKDGAWHKLEVGLLNSYEFSSFFTKECSITAGTTIDVNDFLQYLESKMCKPIPEVLNAVKAIRAENIKTALLTNNWRNFDNTTLLPFNRSTFDVVVESAVVGANKPDPVIYQKCLIELGVKPEDCIFLDDFGSNLRTARSLGIRTIKVENITDALKELEETLMFPLSGYVKGTRAIRKGMEIPQDRLVEYIEDSLRVVPSNNLLNIRQFNHGQSNPTYYVEYGDIRAVLRKKPPGKLMPSAHAVDREYRVMSAMSKAGIPIPRLLSFCDDPTVIGTEFYLMEFVNGAIYKNPRLPGLEIEKRQLIYGNLLQVLSQIHSVNIEEANLSDYGKKGNYIARQVSTWSRQYRASETRTISAIERLMEWLPEHLPADEKTTVVHGDFRLDNLIFDPISHEVLAVIDWELSTLGDPLSDLAYQCLAHFLPKDFPILPGMSGVDLKSAGIFTVEEIVNRYCKLRNIPAIDNFDFYMAFAFFRVSAILQGVYKRSTQGQASSASASAAGKLAGSLAEIGWTFASKEGFRKFNKINPSLLSSKSDHTISSKKNYHTCGIGAVRSYHHGNGKGLLPVTSEALSPRVQTLLKSVKQFITDDIIPMEEEIRNKAESSDPEKKWTVHPCIENLKEKAKSQALWNLFIPIETDPEEEYGAGLTNVEYAYLCEEMGRCIYAPEIFNCSAPDTGNMEVLIKYGSEEQKKKWLEPLLSGSIRSCFSMTEPKVASSDATNIETSISSNGDGWIINGHKWWTSGAMDKRTKFAIVMGKTDSTALRHKQQSMVIVPLDSPGVSIVRPLTVYGLYDAPAGHAELLYENVHVPKKNMILEPGSGFEIAQGRLGPGRIHHCMRLIGHAERSLDLMKERVKSRVAFGKALVEQGTIQQEIAKSRIDIEQARLLVLKTAHMMDTVGNKVAAPEIAMIKVLVPQMAGKVIDRAIQAHGAAGLSSDLPLAIFSMWARALRLADGPDEVHVRSIARMELKS